VKNKVRFEFVLKMSVDQFCEIEHIFQTIYQNELTFYREILDTWNYILVNFQVKWSSKTFYFIGLKLLTNLVKFVKLDLYWDIYESTSRILLRFKWGYKLHIASFPTIYIRPSNSSRWKRITCLKSGLKIYKQCAKTRDSSYMKGFWHEDFVFIILFYLFNYFWIIIFLIWDFSSILDIV